MVVKLLRIGRKTKNIVKKAVESLKKPSQWLCVLASNRTKIVTLLITCIVYFVIGAVLNAKWSFPWFYAFSLCFLFIGTLGIVSISQFSKVMKRITTSVANQPSTKKANLFYFRYCIDSPIYILGPLSIILTFGVGGCLMFGAIRLTPTLVWVLTLFVAVVYLSIIGYIQYIVLAIYICNLAHSSSNYRYLSKSLSECVPAQIEWLQSLTRLSHLFRIVFFTLGSAYILAYGAFCWLPEMQADTASPAFILLWTIIFLVIVLLFPTVSILEYRWIKSIVEKLKKDYIEDLIVEDKMLERGISPVSLSLQKLIQTICVKQILDSKDYPLSSVWTTGYAAIMSIFNFLASAVTILQGVPSLSVVFLQMF